MTTNCTPLDPKAVLVAVGEASGLPLAGAQVLAAHPAHAVRSAVARCPGLDESVRGELIRDRSIHVRRAALRHTTGVGNLRPDADAFPDELVGIAGNPVTPPRVLETLSRHRSERVVREVLANPSAPKAAVLDAARLWGVAGLFARGNTYHHLAGAGQVASVHPEVIQVWAKGPATPGLQPLASHPALTATQAEMLLAATRSREVRLRLAENLSLPGEALKLTEAHQERRAQLRDSLGGQRVTSLLQGSTSDRLQLVRCGSHTLDEQLVAYENLEAEVAIAIAARTTPGQDVDPHVLARIAELVGDEVHQHLTHLSGSSRIAAALLSPVMNRGGQRQHLARTEARAVHALLGEDRGSWELFVGLMPNWESDVVSLAETARRI